MVGGEAARTITNFIFYSTSRSTESDDDFVFSHTFCVYDIFAALMRKTDRILRFALSVSCERAVRAAREEAEEDDKNAEFEFNGDISLCYCYCHLKHCHRTSVSHELNKM